MLVVQCQHSTTACSQRVRICSAYSTNNIKKIAVTKWYMGSKPILTVTLLDSIPLTCAHPLSAKQAAQETIGHDTNLGVLIGSSELSTSIFVV